MYGILISMFGVVFKEIFGFLVSDEVVEYKHAGDLEIEENENIISDYSWLDNPNNSRL